MDKMQFAACAAAWAMRNGVCAERIGLTIAFSGRYACTNAFNVFGVSLEEDLPQSFFHTCDEARAYAYEALEHGLLADVYTYRDGAVVAV
jgi:hypothetical protein